MTPDDDIDSMWMEIRPVRLSPVEPEVPAPPEVAPPQTPHQFTAIRVLLNAAAHHSTICEKEFTSLEGDLGFRCACGGVFRIGLANARRTRPGPLWEYFRTTGNRVDTARRLTHDPRQILLELEALE